MNQDYEKLMGCWERQMALSTALTLFSWDSETLAPPQADENTAKVVGILADQAFEATVNEEVKQLLERLSDAGDLDDSQKACVRKMKEDYEQTAAIPREENRAYSELLAKSAGIWAKAKKHNDFESFLPVLKKVISYQKKFAGCWQKEGDSLYDTLLDHYEKGFRSSDLDRFFGKLKEEIVPLLKQVTAKNDRIDKAYNSRRYPVEKQREFNHFLAEYVGMDFERCVIAESEHPFTTSLHNKDVRITTHYYENDLESAIFSTIHETGHTLYELGIADDLTQTPVGTAVSMGMHESQSRFFENIIGRSRAFWEPVYGRLQELFSEQLGDVSLDDFIRGINKAVPGPVRTEADELTYCLHIMIRYEIEKKLINEDMDLAGLPGLWKKLYEEYLGITPKNDSEGVLQDIHWAQGSIGYFPTYALGNAYSAQIYHTMCSRMDVEQLLREGNLEPIREFLRTNIHCHGYKKTAREILRDVTGEEFNPQYYIDYLKEKYTKLYSL